MSESSKRSRPSKSDETSSKKLKRLQSAENSAEDEFELGAPTFCNDTEAAILFVKNLLTAAHKSYVFPPVVFVHQIYDIIKNRTTVNRQIETLRNDKKIVLIHLGSEENMQIVIVLDDLKTHIFQEKSPSEKLIHQKFFDRVLSNTTDIGVSKMDLIFKHRFSEADIRILVNTGLLILRETGIFWFSFPSAGNYMKKVLKGRQVLLQIIKKRKYREILQGEFNKKQLEKTLDLPLQYLIHDLIGGKFVTCVDTTSGRLLRYVT